jgi:hypothetical protein
VLRKNHYNSPINKRSANIPDTPDQRLLEVLLDPWDRNNTILLNLLRAVPEGGLEASPMEVSPSVAQLFTHIPYVRLIFVFEDAPRVRQTPARGGVGGFKAFASVQRPLCLEAGASSTWTYSRITGT